MLMCIADEQQLIRNQFIITNDPVNDNAPNSNPAGEFHIVVQCKNVSFKLKILNMTIKELYVLRSLQGQLDR